MTEAVMRGRRRFQQAQYRMVIGSGFVAVLDMLQQSARALCRIAFRPVRVIELTGNRLVQVA